MKAQHRYTLAATALLVALVALSIAMPVAAQERPSQHVSTLGAADGRPTPSVEAIVQSSVRMADGSVQVIVTLAGEPAYKAFIASGGHSNFATADSAARGVQSAIAAEQATFSALAGGVGASVVNTSSFLVNTVTVAVAPDAIEALWKLPGVVSISPNRIYQRDHTTSVPLIGAPDVWDSTFEGTGYTGDGVTIAIIDSGIDYTHRHFGGDGNYAGVDPTVNPGNWPPVSLPGAGEQKVIGGTDFVGDDYNASDPGNSTPMPDPNPIDCSNLEGYTGHGTHVAGTAAGWGVTPGDATYDGGYDDGDDLFPLYPAGDLTNWKIGPGVAPEAYLVALRVFGCDGSVGTDVLLDALEYAGANDFLDEGVDVINMSIGSPYGGALDDDPTVDAQNALTELGITVVTSAGNNGNATLVTGAPGTAPSSINVANSVDPSAIFVGGVDENNGLVGDPDDNYGAAKAAFGLINFGTFTDDLILGVDGTAPVNDGCETLTNAADVAGKIVLVDRGGCEFSQKANRALAAGAVGMIVANNVAGAPFTMGNGTAEPAQPGVANLPLLMVSQADGTALKAELAAHAAIPSFLSVDMNDTQLNLTAEATDTIVTSSSRGGIIRSVNDSIFKPNVDAPGNTIASAGAGTNTEPNIIGGTSMASPHVAGLVALLLEQDSALTPWEVKAKVMNTANAPIVGAVPAGTQPPQRVGSGRVQAVNAASTPVIAYSADTPENVAVSFGYPKVLAGTTHMDSKTITVENLSGTPVDFNVTYTPRSDMAGVSFGVTPATISVGANSTTTVTVTLTANPNQPGINVITAAFDGSSAGTTFLTEESGLVTLTPTAGSTTTLVVPVYAAPHVTSDMHASDDVVLLLPGSTSTSINLDGTGVLTGGNGSGTNIISLVSAFELVADDGPDAPASYVPRPGDDLAQDENEAGDILYVGAASDMDLVADPEDGYVYFGLVSNGEWNINKEQLIILYIDADQDGDADWGYANSFGVSNQTIQTFYDINNYLGGGPELFYSWEFLNGFSGAAQDTMLFKNNVVVFRADLGYVNTLAPVGNRVDGEFDFWIETFSRDADFDLITDTVGDSANPYTYDPFNPALSFAGGGPGQPTWVDLPGFSVPVDVDPALTEYPDILLLHHHNTTASSRYEVVSIEDAEGLFDLLTPEDGLFVRDASTELAEFTWEDAGTPAYNFILVQLTSNVSRLGVIVDATFSAAADSDELTCDGTTSTCTFDASGLAPLPQGEYVWSAHAVQDIVTGESVEADNAPFYFKVFEGDIEFITNGGFEDGVDKTATGWEGKRKCVPEKANTGDCYFQGKPIRPGKPAKFMTQTVVSTFVDDLSAGDELTFSLAVNANAEAAKVAHVVLKYSDPTAGEKGKGKDKVKIKVETDTVGYEVLSAPVNVAADVTEIKVKLGSKKAKSRIDDVSLLWAGSAPREGGLLPPPAAPDGFRGGN